MHFPWNVSKGSTGTRRTGTRLLGAVVVLALVLAGAVPAAHALLERVGPTDPAFGFPQWYQDKTGVSMEFCSPLNAAELDGGWCVLFTGDTVAPEVFPGAFADEHFYYAADALDRRIPNPANPATTFLAFLRLGLEGAFLNGPVVAGDQMVFARLRIKVTPIPIDGDYTVYTPAGKFTFPGLRTTDPRGLFFTNDVGLTAGVFTDALNGDLGPFLVPSAVPGGPEMAPLTATNPIPDADPAHFGGAPLVTTPYPGTGKAYIGDPGRTGPVTGSPLPDFVLSDGITTLNPNVFRVEVVPTGSTTPIVLFETFDFGVRGRFFTSTIPGRVSVDRASYVRNATGQKVDVFATGFETVQSRLPTQPTPVAITPALSFFDAACGGTVDPTTGTVSPPFTAPTVAATETPMVNSGSNFWGQAQPAVIPAEVCVHDAAARDATGAIIAGGAFFPRVVTDEIDIASAVFDPNVPSLTVTAKSLDEIVPPTLTLALTGAVDTASPATWTLSPLVAPPAKVKVLSSAGGSAEYPVWSGFKTGPPAGTPVANNDTATTAEDTPVIIAVLANDTGVTGGTVSLVAAPALGTAAVQADGTVRYTPNLNRNGTDAFTYHVTTVGGTVSNTATVTVAISPVNDNPVANPDTLSATANIQATLNVLANDTDPDVGDVLSVANVSAVTAAAGTLGTATATAAGNAVTFIATAAGSYTFTYQARDAALALSNPATVTVTVSAAETLTIARAQVITSNPGRYRVDGTITPDTGQTITIQLTNTAGTVLRTDTVVEAAGVWAVDVKPFVLPTGANRVVVRSSNGTVATAPLIIK